MTKFRPTKKRVYWWPVTVRYPDPDPAKAGEIAEETFKARFEEIPRDEAKRLQEEMAALPYDKREEKEHELIIRVMTGWNEDVVDEGDQPIPFSGEALRSVLQSSYARLAINTAYFLSLTGEAARKGN